MTGLPRPSAKPASQYAPKLASVRSATRKRDLLISTRSRSSIDPARGVSSRRKRSKPALATAGLKWLRKMAFRISFPNAIAIRAPDELDDRRVSRSKSSHPSKVRTAKAPPLYFSASIRPRFTSEETMNSTPSSSRAPIGARAVSYSIPVFAPGYWRVSPSQRTQFSTCSPGLGSRPSASIHSIVVVLTVGHSLDRCIMRILCASIAARSGESLPTATAAVLVRTNCPQFGQSSFRASRSVGNSCACDPHTGQGTAAILG